MSSFRGVVLALLVLALPAFAEKADMGPFQKEFSADMVMSGKGMSGKEKAQMTQRLYVSKGRMRMEISADGQQMVSIHDMKNNTYYMLMPEQKMAMDMSATMKQARERMGGLKPEDMLTANATPCDKKSAKQTCEKLGTEKVNGRTAEKWRITDKEKGDKTSTVWIDQDVKMVVRYESPEATMDVKNLQEGKQDDSLFEVPKDYKVMAMPGRQPPPKEE
jgi:outer membrane lipoprotein-sorting protein